MENISIEPTKKSLEVECSPGYFKLSGNSILSDPRKFFQPIVEWIEEYAKDPKDKTTVDLKLEYVDTASVQSVFDIILNCLSWVKSWRGVSASSSIS